MSGEFVGLPQPPEPGRGAGRPVLDDALPAPAGIPAAVSDAADLRAAMRAATVSLRAAKIESPRADAELLAGHLLGVDRGRVAVLAMMGAPVPAGYPELVAARAQRIPLQHLTGHAAFRGLELEVGPGVFVPRPETELVAGAAIDAAEERLRAGHLHPLVLDLCTGSGAIAAAVAAEVPAAHVVAVELSEPALAWAGRNLAGTGVELIAGDALTAAQELAGGVHVLVSNPPYVPGDREHRDPEVGVHDPVQALYGGGADGMQMPTALIRRAEQLLAPAGTLVMEHDESQGRAMEQALSGPAWQDVSVHRDLTGRDRFTTARRSDLAGGNPAQGVG